MNRYTAGNSDRPFWIEAYGGRRYSIDRESKDRRVIPRLTVSLVGAIQPEPLNSLLLKPDDDGLVARFCPFWPLLSPPRRPSSSIDPRFAVDAFTRLLSLEMGKDEQGGPVPVLVPFSAEAQDHLDRFVVEVSRLEKEAEGDGLLVSFIGKLPGTAVRLALLLSFLDWAATPHSSPPHEVGEGRCGAGHSVRNHLLGPNGKTNLCRSSGEPGRSFSTTPIEINPRRKTNGLNCKRYLPEKAFWPKDAG